MLQQIEKRFVGEISPLERTVWLHGALWFFLILLGYYILRPIREQISSTYGIQNLSWLFWATFTAMLIAVPIYSALVGKVHRRTLVPMIYFLFVGCLAGFWIAFRFVNEESKIWVARCLYVWISVYGLFVVSFFWSIVGDLLTTEQGSRLFGFIAGGGTIGGLLGSQVAAQSVESLGVANLILIPAVLLTIAYFVYARLESCWNRLADQKIEKKNGNATGGNPFAGFYAVFESRYLLAICGYGFLLALCGTTVYFQQSEIVRRSIDTEEARTAYFANVNFYVSLATMVFQFFIVSRLIKFIGLGWTLAALPMAYIIGIASLAMSPEISVLAVISVLGRAAEYGIANPAREVLFTTVNREDRYKAKSFVDTVVRRGGDTVVGSIYRAMRESFGFAMTTMSWMIVPLAIAWTGLALFIGSENNKFVEKSQQAND